MLGETVQNASTGQNPPQSLWPKSCAQRDWGQKVLSRTHPSPACVPIAPR